jgi:hypothetical protein
MKIALYAIVAVFVLIQFIRPEKNLSAATPGSQDLIVMHQPPTEVRDLLQRACYDCHSDRTHYPWYAEIQPVGWWLADHVQEGKEHLNFSTFGGYSLKRQEHKLDEVIEMVREKEMPLASYKLTHGDARLTDAEIRTLTAWAEQVRDSIEMP